MRAWLITAAPISKEDLEFYRTIRPQKGDIIVCADGGYDNAIQFGMLPSVVIGDMDSINSSIIKGTKIIKYPTQKEKTDTELAVDYAIDEGAEEIVILGNIGGRLSHSIANIMLLRYINKKDDIEAMLLSSKERVCLLKNGETSIAKGDSKFLSLIPLTNCEGVTILQTKYEVQDINVEIGSTHLVSNEFTALNAKISIKSGEALIIAEK